MVAALWIHLSLQVEERREEDTKELHLLSSFDGADTDRIYLAVAALWIHL